MENINFQQYRDELALQIRREPDRNQRREILSGAKQTDAYQEARRLRRESVAREKNQAISEKLIGYANEYCAEYAGFSPELVDLINQIRDNSADFETRVLPNISDELLDQIVGLMEGLPDESVILLLKRANFDYQSLLSSDRDDADKVRALAEAILKAQSYDEAVELNREKEIGFSGFEADPDIPDAKLFIHQAFSQELLQKCLISKINYTPDKVNVSLNGVDYLLPIDVYQEWESQMPEVRTRKFRAESLVLWNTDPDFSKKFIPTPVYFFSFYGERPEELNYLDNIPEQDKMRLYKLGTIAHEIGHHLYDYLMDLDSRLVWKQLVDKVQTVTKYAAKYSGHGLKYDEFFCEAIRLKTTVPEYFEVHFAELDQFIAEKFPEVAKPQA